MRAVVILSLLAVVYAAPLAEINTDTDIQQEDERVNMVKRAKEFMMFGNQQDEFKEKEKRSEADDGDNTVDKLGEIVAAPPSDIIQEEEPAIAQGEVDPPQVESNENTNLPVDGNMVLNEPDMLEESEAGSEEENANGMDGEEEEQQTDESVEDEPLENNMNGMAIKPNDVDADPEAAMYEEYMRNSGNELDPYLVSMLGNQYGRPEPSIPSLYDYLTGNYRQSQSRHRVVSPKSRVLKRARRIKRDLYFTNDILGRNYDPYGEQYVDNKTPYEADQVDLEDDEIRYLLSLLENAERYEEEATPEYENQLYQPNSGYLEPELEPQDSEYYIPKRQAGLTFVPGLKRSREFYPYFEEPEAHFAAFVPQKRSRNNYGDAYQRLMELAAELRAESSYPREEYNFENYYRRK